MIQRHSARCAASALLIVLLGGSATDGRAADWPQWRGPGGRGVSEEKGFPEEWTAERNVAWKTPLPGRGLSSPIVTGKRVFLTTAVEGAVIPGAKAVKHELEGKEFVHPDSMGADRSQALYVLGLDLDTGKLLWQEKVYEGAVHDNRHRGASYASLTPATDGERVYSSFGPEGVYCHDLDGRLVWKASVGKFGMLGLGLGSSPVLHRGLLILQCDGSGKGEPFIAALDAKTGEERWRVRRDAQVSWSSPIVTEAQGRFELLTVAPERTIAYDPASGKELWRARGIESYAVHTPLAGEGCVVVSAGYPRKRVLAFRPGPPDGAEDPAGAERFLWEYTRGTAYVVSPILYRGQVYLPTDGGALTCLELKTGKVVYEGKRLPRPTRLTASPVAADGRIFLTSEDGDTIVVEAGPEHRVLHTNSLGERVEASLALSQGRIVVRGEKNAYCIRRPG